MQIATGDKDSMMTLSNSPESPATFEDLVLDSMKLVGHHLSMIGAT